MRMSVKKLKPFIYPAAFILIALISMVYKLVITGNTSSFISTISGESVELSREPDEEEPSYIEQESEPSESSIEMCSIYLCGEVVSPGVYEVPKGSLLNDAVNLAGGLTPEADMNRINLVYVIGSNFSVYIPSEDFSGGGDEIIRSGEDYIWGQGDSSGVSHAGLVNINTAGKDELMTLPGIGEVTANAIISYREDNSFSSIEDIKNVSGIGDAKFNNIKAYITV